MWHSYHGNQTVYRPTLMNWVIPFSIAAKISVISDSVNFLSKLYHNSTQYSIYCFFFLSGSDHVPHLGNITYEELFEVLYLDSIVPCHDTLFDLPFYYVGMWVA